MIDENVRNIQLAEIEVSYSNKIKKNQRVNIQSSTDVYEICKCIWKYPMDHRESSYALYFDRSNNLLGYFLVSVEGIDGTLIDVRIVVQTALKINASSIILAHNHPSCNNKASDGDIQISKKISEACNYLGLKFLDHLIVHSNGYLSMADEGLI